MTSHGSHCVCINSPLHPPKKQKRLEAEKGALKRKGPKHLYKVAIIRILYSIFKGVYLYCCCLIPLSIGCDLQFLVFTGMFLEKWLENVPHMDSGSGIRFVGTLPDIIWRLVMIGGLGWASKWPHVVFFSRILREKKKWCADLQNAQVLMSWKMIICDVENEFFVKPAEFDY